MENVVKRFPGRRDNSESAFALTFDGDLFIILTSVRKRSARFFRSKANDPHPPASSNARIARIQISKIPSGACA
jgi:hypothetical protein